MVNIRYEDIRIQGDTVAKLSQVGNRHGLPPVAADRMKTAFAANRRGAGLGRARGQPPAIFGIRCTSLPAGIGSSQAS